MFNFRRIILFSLEKRLSKHKMTIVSKNLGGMTPFPPLAAPMDLQRGKLDQEIHLFLQHI